MSVLYEGDANRREVSFEKYHGTGNEFVVVDADCYVPDRAAFATRYCDASDGIGADGVLFLSLEERYRPPRVVMTLVQPDGGTAAMCGNGARCAAEWAARRTGAEEVMVDTQAGTRHARVEKDQNRVTIEMGAPAFDPEAVPVDPRKVDGLDRADDPVVCVPVAAVAGDDHPLADREVTAVNTDVPHAVVFVDDVDAVDLAAAAPPIRHADAFPEGANVNVATPRAGGGFEQRTYERGVEDETDSCGTGAVAIVAAAQRLGVLEDEHATVSPPGGDLEITVPETGSATLEGPVVYEFDGEVPARPRAADGNGEDA